MKGLYIRTYSVFMRVLGKVIGCIHHYVTSLLIIKCSENIHDGSPLGFKVWNRVQFDYFIAMPKACDRLRVIAVRTNILQILILQSLLRHLHTKNLIKMFLLVEYTRNRWYVIAGTIHRGSYASHLFTPAWSFVWITLEVLSREAAATIYICCPHSISVHTTVVHVFFHFLWPEQLSKWNILRTGENFHYTTSNFLVVALSSCNFLW